MSPNTLQSKAEMLIRRPAAEVYEAFIDPAVTTQFWFTHSSGRLEAGKQVEWKWEMYNVSAQVDVKALEQNKRILIEWPGYSGKTQVEITLMPQSNNTTFVSIAESGFTGETGKLIQQIIDSTEAFTMILAGLKALLEHNIRLNLIADRFPAGLEQSG